MWWLVTGSNRKYKWTDQLPRAIRPRADFHRPLFLSMRSSRGIRETRPTSLVPLPIFPPPLAVFHGVCETNIIYREWNLFVQGIRIKTITLTSGENSFDFIGRYLTLGKKVWYLCNFILYFFMINDLNFFLFLN